MILQVVKKITKNEKNQEKQPRITLKQPLAPSLTNVMLRSYV
jgi:hypothetical protein